MDTTVLGVKGSLSDLAIADLIRRICLDRKTLKLQIRHSFQHASVFFLNGEIIHAELGNQTGEEVIKLILNWEEGFYSFDYNSESPLITINRSWLDLLGQEIQPQGEMEIKADKLEISNNIQLEERKMNQNFDDILTELAGQISGYSASVLVGLDGINVASNAKGNLDPDAISAQMTMLLKLVDSSVEKISAGVLEDNLTTTENAYILMRFLSGKQYYLGITADRKTGNLGNMRLISKLYSERLAKAMPQ